MTKEEFSKLMIVIHTIFQTKADNKTAMAVWYKSLCDLDYDLATQAIKNLARTHSGYLYPAQIRKACVDVINPKASFTEGYKLVNDVVQNFGRYRHKEAMEYLKSQNAAMYKVVEAIGFQSLCSSNPDFSRNLVEKMYRDVQKRGNDQLLIGNFKDDISGLKKLEVRQ